MSEKYERHGQYIGPGGHIFLPWVGIEGVGASDTRDADFDAMVAKANKWLEHEEFIKAAKKAMRGHSVKPLVAAHQDLDAALALLPAEEKQERTPEFDNLLKTVSKDIRSIETAEIGEATRPTLCLVLRRMLALIIANREDA